MYLIISFTYHMLYFLNLVKNVKNGVKNLSMTLSHID